MLQEIFHKISISTKYLDVGTSIWLKYCIETDLRIDSWVKWRAKILRICCKFNTNED